ncbi:MAG TPA: NTP transferase domain-containing protein [Rugosimonospora sp.]|nr:NTP transferase domain-containing protein [Rugosimonospora sp.]
MGDGYSALVLAGGAGRRLGGPGKPVLPVGGATMLDRVLAAVGSAAARIVVGPDALPLPPGVRLASEQPPGGGPVAAIAAGLPLVPTAEVALLAADLPFLSAGAIAELRGALRGSLDGAVFVDGDGRRQTLCGVWHTAALRARVAGLSVGEPGGGALGGRSLRELLAGLAVAEVAYHGGGPPPWYDCDTPAELERAERWVE